MPASTNNYTAHEPTLPLIAKKQYYMEGMRSSSSIVIAGGKPRIELNSRIHKLLDEYSLLKNNWDDDGALAFDSKVIQRARNLVILLEGYSQRIFHCAPGPNGEIMLDIRNNSNNKSIEILLYPNRSVAVSFPEQGRPIQEDFNIDALPHLLTWLFF